MSHVAPSQSTAHQVLLEEAKNAGFSPKRIRRFLWLINAHDDLLAFPLVCRSLGLILGRVEEYAIADMQAMNIRDWPEIIAWTQEHQHHLSERIGESFSRGSESAKTGHPLLGYGAVRHPLYTALCDCPADKDSQGLFHLLAGHFVVAHVSLFTEFVPLSQYESHAVDGEIIGPPRSTYHAALGLRAMSDPDSKPLLMSIKPFLNHNEFIRSAKFTLGNLSDNNQEKRFRLHRKLRAANPLSC